VYPKPVDEDLIFPDDPTPSWGKVGHFGTADLGGIMSQDPSINPDFHDWNKVFLHYCDGGSFSTSRHDPIDVFTKGGAPVQMWQRGRQVFNALVGHLQTSLGLDHATEVILSGGSSGGLAVFYNIDHLASLLPSGVRLTGFPDGGFFIDAKNRYGSYAYQNWFRNMDQQWNTTGGGGTNKACLAAATPGEEWKCLMAPYIAPHITTPLYVMNSPFDSFATSAILWAQCIPAPGIICTSVQTQLLKSFHDQFKRDIQESIIGDEDQATRNGIYSPCCYVHEQNVNYCSYDNFSPNCAGWSAEESGSKKWGYRTSVQASDGRSLTPQQAFRAWYNGDVVAGNVTDSHEFFDNPTCAYMGKAPVIPGYPIAGTAISDSLPCSTSVPTAAPTAPTEPCMNGVLSGNKKYCCEASCGTCGGAGCGRRNGTCCMSQIQDACVEDGDVSCIYLVATTKPTLAPTVHPTSPPTPQDTSLCYECTDDVTPWMASNGRTCKTSPGNIASKCNEDDLWASNRYCQQTCFDAGRGYSGIHCCTQDSLF